MCGIIAVLSTSVDSCLKQKVSTYRTYLEHRGPDHSGMASNDFVVMGHRRLAIVDPSSNAQPFVTETGDILAVNGEIYNHQQLRDQHPFDYQTKSDCEVIIPVGADVKQLDGMYGFALWQNSTQELIIARDPMGIIPLYYGFRGEGELWIASELKVLQAAGAECKVFPPGNVWIARVDSTVHLEKHITYQYRQIFAPQSPLPSQKLLECQHTIRHQLKTAVQKMMMADVKYGVLLSGGLDSSLVASLVSRYSTEPLHSFCIGLEGSPDLENARKVADFLGTIHHEIKFTVQQALDELHMIIWHTETYDVTTIRASTPMYLLAKYIKQQGFKMVFSGEGADEVMAGYMYFHRAPSPEELYAETIDKVKQLHQFDCLRANKSMMAHSVELRPPFLDTDLVQTLLHLNPAFKMVTADQPIEKWVLRSAFDRPDNPYLPNEILWRQKEQFSDGVGFDWIDGLKAYADTQVSDQLMADVKDKFPIHPPKTKEAYLYRSMFEMMFPNAIETVPYGDSIACSTPRAMEWDESFKLNADPSGRSVSVHHCTNAQPVSVHHCTNAQPVSVHHCTNAQPVSVHHCTNAQPVSVHHCTNAQPVSVHHCTNAQ